MNKQPDITTATKEALMTAFFQLAEMKPFHKITIHDITARAGYNRTTFYRYFEDVFDLIRVAEEQLIDDILADLLPNIEQAAAFDDRFFQFFLAHFHASKERLAIFLSDEHRATFIKRLQERLEKLGLVTAETSPYHRTVMTIYFNGIFAAMLHHIRHPEEMSDQALLAIVRELFITWYWPALSRNA